MEVDLKGDSEGLYFGCHRIFHGTTPLCSGDAFECCFIEQSLLAQRVPLG